METPHRAGETRPEKDLESVGEDSRQGSLPLAGRPGYFGPGTDCDSGSRSGLQDRPYREDGGWSWADQRALDRRLALERGRSARGRRDRARAARASELLRRGLCPRCAGRRPVTPGRWSCLECRRARAATAAPGRAGGGPRARPTPRVDETPTYSGQLWGRKGSGPQPPASRGASRPSSSGARP